MSGQLSAALIVVFKNKQLTVFRYGNPLMVPLPEKHGLGWCFSANSTINWLP